MRMLIRLSLAVTSVAVAGALVGAGEAKAQLPVLDRGDRGPAVEFWQGELNQWLDVARPGERILGEDAVFGPRTEAATRELQRAASIRVDGIVGSATWEALYRELGSRATTVLRGNDAVTPSWPIPVPRWFWSWARWYLGRAEFDGRARDPAVRPAAPTVIPNWAWRRMKTLDGSSLEERALTLARHRLQRLFGADSVEIAFQSRSDLAPNWILLTGSFEGRNDAAFAAWMRLVRGRWTPWNIGTLGRVNLTPRLVPCDLKPAFSEPMC